MRKKHANLTLSKNGLIISPSYPFMGASPDGIIECSCCGYGVLEIKCPYSCRDKTLQERVDESKFYLSKIGGDLSLDVYHAYYFQVQLQLKLSGANYCDFAVWNEDDLFIQRLTLDEPFVSIAMEKCNEFIQVCVLPEILGKWYSREPLSTIQCSHSSECEEGKTPVWCYCRKEESGTMIACDDEACQIVWFHAECLRIKKIPKGTWLCPDCRKKRKQKSKKL